MDQRPEDNSLGLLVSHLPSRIKVDGLPVPKAADGSRTSFLEAGLWRPGALPDAGTTCPASS